MTEESLSDVKILGAAEEIELFFMSESETIWINEVKWNKKLVKIEQKQLFYILLSIILKLRVVWFMAFFTFLFQIKVKMFG